MTPDSARGPPRAPAAPPRAPAAPIGALLLGLAACGGEGEVASGDLLPTPHRTGVVEARFGEVDGALVFGTIVGLHLGPDGNLYLTERERGDIRVLTPDGEVLRTIGGPGPGPGEFLLFAFVVEWVGDTLVVWDGRRWSRFDAAGTFLDSETMPSSSRVAWPGPPPVTLRADRPLTGGTFVARGTPPGLGAVMAWMSGDGRILEILYTYPPPERAEASFLGCEYSINQPAGPRPIWTIDERSGRMVTVDWTREPEPAMQVIAHTLEGDTLFRTRVPYLPIPPDPELVERTIETRSEQFRRRCPSVPLPVARRLVIESTRWPEERPPLTNMRLTADGGVWIRLRPEAFGRFEEPEPVRSWWVAIGADGTVEGSVGLPLDFAPHEIRDSIVWGVLQDELGVNYVARVRVKR